jgi:hypothetical protein
MSKEYSGKIYYFFPNYGDSVIVFYVCLPAIHTPAKSGKVDDLN